MRLRLAPILAVCLLSAATAWAEKKTVCTITVNSSDEKETFRQNLPKDKYQFVELVEKGRHDWLASSCRKGIQCDVLVVSGHFNAGETFYSDNIKNDEYLQVDELERASCSDSCPALFSKLKSNSLIRALIFVGSVSSVTFPSASVANLSSRVFTDALSASSPGTSTLNSLSFT